MPQRLRFVRPLDRRRPGAYLLVLGALAATAAGCSRAAPAPVVPAGAQPVTPDQVASWVAPTTPEGHQIYRFKWLFQDERSSAGGSGSARLAGPDSLRFDVRGPLGAGAAAAFVVGDTAVWTDPEDIIQRLVPNFPLMWAMFGVARLPEPGRALQGAADGATTVWQYVGAGDTLSYARTVGEKGRLVTEFRERGKVVGRAETALGPDGRPLTARLTVPSVPARLDITFVSSSDTTAFPARVWRRPPPRQ
ncbi:MAG TPA: hypothetical protein VFS40_02015 [Gemmatimonadales bacterium]|nr:hypothetical protein [Gemmatimonadales bacterium]